MLTPSKIQDKDNGLGFFGGRGEGLDDIMEANVGPIGVYSRGHIGWRDSVRH